MLVLILSLLSAGFLLDLILNILNSKRKSVSLPDLLKDIYNQDQYEKSVSYEQANTKLSIYKSTFNFLLTVILIISGGFAQLDAWTYTITTDFLFASLLFFGVIFFASDIIDLPFSIYKTFVIEERFGFNRMTGKLFITDKIKGYLIAIFIGGSLLSMFILFYQLAGASFWIYAWIAFSVVSILLSMFYASVFVPMFNKLKPLEAGSLREKIEAYCNKQGFKLDNLFVMDGSKRSSKANAFFSGLGPRKKIVLFDTLIARHTDEELVAVLAHEIGHYKLKHTRTSIILSVLQMGIMLFLLSWFIGDERIAFAFGSDHSSFVLGLFGFTILYTPVSLLISLAMNLLSRKHEYEADRFAANTWNGPALMNALKKLSADNLSNILPHPLYVFFYYSHPTLLQRLTALQNVR